MKSVLLAGRTDGFGARLCAFIRALTIAKREGLDLRFYWPSLGGVEGRGVNGTVLDIFPEYSPVVHFKSLREDPSLGQAQFLHNYASPQIEEIRSTYMSMSLSDELKIASRQICDVDLCIHARIGDLEDKPLYWGMDRFFPRQGYIKVLERIAEKYDSKSKVFLATDDPHLPVEARRIFPGIMTESELITSVGMTGAKGAVKLWLVVTQLSKTNLLIRPKVSAFTELSRIIASREYTEVPPAKFIGIEDLYEEINRLFSFHAIDLLSQNTKDNSSCIDQIYKNLGCIPPFLSASDRALISTMKPKPCPVPIVRFGEITSNSLVLPDDLTGIKAGIFVDRPKTTHSDRDLATLYPIACYSYSTSLGSNALKLRSVVGDPCQDIEHSAVNHQVSVPLNEIILNLSNHQDDDLLLSITLRRPSHQALLGIHDDLIQRFRIIFIDLYRLGVCRRANVFRKELAPLLLLLKKNFVCVHIIPCTDTHPSGAKDYIVYGLNINIPSHLQLSFLRKDRLPHAPTKISRLVTPPQSLVEDRHCNHSVLLNRFWHI